MRTKCKELVAFLLCILLACCITEAAPKFKSPKFKKNKPKIENRWRGHNWIPPKEIWPPRKTTDLIHRHDTIPKYNCFPTSTFHIENNSKSQSLFSGNYNHREHIYYLTHYSKEDYNSVYRDLLKSNKNLQKKIEAKKTILANLPQTSQPAFFIRLFQKQIGGLELQIKILQISIFLLIILLGYLIYATIKDRKKLKYRKGVFTLIFCFLFQEALQAQAPDDFDENDYYELDNGYTRIAVKKTSELGILFENNLNLKKEITDLGADSATLINQLVEEKKSLGEQKNAIESKRNKYLYAISFLIFINGILILLKLKKAKENKKDESNYEPKTANSHSSSFNNTSSEEETVHFEEVKDNKESRESDSFDEFFNFDGIIKDMPKWGFVGTIPVLLKFYSTQSNEELPPLSSKYSGKIKIIKINTSANIKFASRCHVETIPSYFFIKKNTNYIVKEGELTTEEIISIIDKYLLIR